MPDDKPNPLDDLRKGLGLLFRAARTTIEQLPTENLEKAVISGAKEVGRALENVAHTVEQQVLRKPTAHPTDGEAKPDEAKGAAAPDEAKKDEPPAEPKP